MRTKLLIATTDEKGLIFANIETDRKYFSVSFDEVNAFIADEDYLRERCECMLDGYGKDDLYDLCERNDCKPSELADIIYRDSDISEIIDISLFSDSFIVDGCEADVYFESNGCGQHDTREYATPLNQHIYDMIHDCWDNFHLKSLEEINPEKLNSFIEQIREYEESFDEIDTIQNLLNEWYK